MSNTEETRKILDEIFGKFPVLNIDDNYYLRQLDAKDASLYYKFYNEPDIKKYIPDSMVPSTVEHAKEEIEYIRNIYKNRECIYWAIARKDNNELVGGCGFNQWSRYNGRIEIAYDLRSEYWGRGIMKRALPIIIAYAFLKLKVTRIQATMLPDNIQSRSLLEKHIGFKHEGLLRKYKFFKGNFADILMFSYTLEDFISSVNNNSK